MSSFQPPPKLSDKYSGIPERLLEKATAMKREVVKLSTSEIVPRPSNVELPVIPSGYSRPRFNRAIESLRTLIGPENVELNNKPLDDGWYLEHPNTHDAFHLVEQEEMVSAATVYPASTEEVVHIVRWANKFEIPIYAISMGRNLGYGGAAARVRGSVIVDLGKRMTKILDINPDTCTCLLEPGVSFYALYEEIQRRGHHHLWVDVPDLGGGSVLGNTVDRGVGYTPYGNHFECHSGMEVVLPTGDVIRTGMGALPGNNTWQIFPYGFGPYADGIFTQSNFGIVTKIGMTLMPNPGGSEGFMCTFKEEEDLAQIIEVVRPLRIRNILENVAQLKHVIQEVALLGKPRTHWYQGKGQIPLKRLREIASTLPCGDCSWVYYGNVYGPKKNRDEKLKMIRDAFETVPGARWIPRDSLPKDHYMFSREKIASGIPEFEELRWLNWHKNGSHVFFSPVSAPRGEDAMKLFNIAKKWHDECDLDSFPACCIGLREMYVIVNMVYDRGDPVSKDNAYRCMRGMIKDAAEAGFGEYRTHLLLSDQVAGTYSWNNNALMKFHESIKDTLDPNGILAPGRNGIWPKKYRNKGWELGENDLGPRTQGLDVSHKTREAREGDFKL
ncbi:vanillyl-alcohol oxidase [Dactylonectria estremocensis]|uniref:Vanillyl-alcohol oxidase n=1 Tax=Dactylonectria estremocensis TaxID=1079267 RepID=A0A9P9J4T4_9HYPO|nr:vanillyl-alcohol oxidase [Dactylonectria estremocensis]